jgi:hypothetical protein
VWVERRRGPNYGGVPDAHHVRIVVAHRRTTAPWYEPGREAEVVTKLDDPDLGVKVAALLGVFRSPPR